MLFNKDRGSDACHVVGLSRGQIGDADLSLSGQQCPTLRTGTGEYNITRPDPVITMELQSVRGHLMCFSILYYHFPFMNSFIFVFHHTARCTIRLSRVSQSRVREQQDRVPCFVCAVLHSHSCFPPSPASDK